MDRSAFEQQARSWRKKALQVSINCGAGREEAEDIAQDVMLRLWQMHDDLDRYEKPEALVALMSRHLLRNHQRRRKQERLRERLRVGAIAGMGEQSSGILIDEAMVVSLSSSPHDLLEMKDDDAWLDKRLRQLPTTQRTLLYLREVERRSHEDIARLLGIETTSVSTLLARARRTLLEEIKQRNKQ